MASFTNPNVGLSVLSIKAGESILSPTALMRLKCQVVAQSQRPATTAPPRRRLGTGLTAFATRAGTSRLGVSSIRSQFGEPSAFGFAAPSASMAPASPAAGELAPLTPSSSVSGDFLDMSDLRLPLSPAPTTPSNFMRLDPFDDVSSLLTIPEEGPLPVKMQDDAFDDDEDMVAEEDPALKLASLLVNSHEAGFDMDSLPTQIAVASLR